MLYAIGKHNSRNFMPTSSVLPLEDEHFILPGGAVERQHLRLVQGRVGSRDLASEGGPRIGNEHGPGVPVQDRNLTSRVWHSRDASSYALRAHRQCAHHSVFVERRKFRQPEWPAVRGSENGIRFWGLKT